MPTYGLDAAAAFKAPPQQAAGYFSPLAPSGYTSPVLGGTRQNATGGRAGAAATASGVQRPTSGAFAPPAPNNPLQAPGNNLTTPGYGEQALEYTQNRLLEDPYGAFQNQQAQSTRSPQPGESYMNENLGTLDGPGP